MTLQTATRLTVTAVIPPCVTDVCMTQRGAVCMYFTQPSCNYNH